MRAMMLALGLLTVGCAATTTVDPDPAEPGTPAVEPDREAEQRAANARLEAALDSRRLTLDTKDAPLAGVIDALAVQADVPITFDATVRAVLETEGNGVQAHVKNSERPLGR